MTPPSRECTLRGVIYNWYDRRMLSALRPSRYFFLLLLVLVSAQFEYPVLCHAAPSRVGRTLKVNEGVSVHSASCRLSLRSSSPAKIVVECEGDIERRDYRISPTRPYLAANQSAVIRAKSCLLTVQQRSGTLIKLKCLPKIGDEIPTPTPTPTSVPTIVGPEPTSTAVPTVTPTLQATTTLTPIPTLTPTSTATPTPSPTSTPGTTSLVVSASSMALSVLDVGLNAELTGNPRTITVTNAGSFVATDVTVDPSSALPSGTIYVTTCGTLAPSDSCTITVTPGGSASSAPGDVSPTPIVFTISGTNTNTVTTSVQILAYGSVYQGGYLFSIDDSTSSNTSIGGKLLALTDQSTFEVWAPNTSFVTCGASSITDGAANTTAIVSCLGGGTYAATLCTTLTTAGFTDWYLPSICEWSLDSGTGCPMGLANINNMLANGAIGSTVFPVDRFYWSSTEFSGSPSDIALFNSLVVGSPGSHFGDFKDILSAVRCVRQITN